MRHIAIIGGGFSGALTAINLLRHDGPRATLIERNPVPARGTAYGTLDPAHLLNVRAANMSAFPDDGGHFARWLGGEPGTFAQRRQYGDYLEELLRTAAATAPDRLTLVRGDAIDIHDTGDARAVRLADGREIMADAVALAVGNLPPATPPGIDPEAVPPGTYIADPWRGEIAAGLGADDTVAVIGTGLTMVDVVLLLEARGFTGRIVALSRRGLLPIAHAPVTPPPPLAERPMPEPLALLRAVRARAAQVPWRGAIDELRPMTQDLWRAMSLDGRRRFLRHLRPWWDAHRHRIAPSVAATIARLREEGRLTVVAGRIASIANTGDGTVLRYAPRGEAGIIALPTRRIVNATGPQGHVAGSDEPLLRALHDRGLIRPDPLGIGLDVDQDSHALGRDGSASDWLMVLGPMTRGAFWEIVAVPDISRQAWSVARRLSNAHWVGGEGL